MPIQMELNAKGGTTDKPVKIFTRQVDNLALTQLKNLAKLDIIHHHVAAMPDVHAGVGSTVGSVIPTKNAIIPAAVGVDIGCGMNALRLSIKGSQLPDHLKPLRLAIERAVPVGPASHKRISAREKPCKPLADDLHLLFQKHPKLVKSMRRPNELWWTQMGTLGSGNHFIELCIDQSDDVWVMLHSGSRGIGNAIGQYFIAKARKDMSRHIANLPDRDLAYFTEGSDYFDDYVFAVDWAQRYAAANRDEMMNLVLRAIAPLLPEFVVTQQAINCHHNYVEKENHFGENVYVTRKGAISAYEGQLGIIPGSMGTKSYIVRGKGNRDAFCSCSHGAGRKMTRTKARKLFKRVDMEAQTKGVECRKDKGVLDEIPGAYKDIDEVMENQTDLVEVVHTLKQVVCVKG